MVAELVDVYTRRPMSEGDYLEGDYAHLGQRSSHYVPSATCRVCGGPLPKPFLDFGTLPPANAFHLPGQSPIVRYPVAYVFCPACYLVQIVDPVPPSALFGSEYVFLTSSSAHMVEHYRKLAAHIRTRYQPKAVLEIGSNDGGVIEHLCDLSPVGIEPSANVAAIARSKGLRILERFFGEETACWIASGGAALAGVPQSFEVIIACHVATHLPDQADFFRAVDLLLAHEGVLIMEDPSQADVIANGGADQYYEEHVAVYSLPALVNLLARHDLEVIDVEPQPVHGGSLRITAARKGTCSAPSPSVAQRLAREKFLTRPWTYRLFGDATERKFEHFKALVLSLKSRGYRIAGYGATSKSLIPLMRCGLGPDTIDYITDTTPTKQGKLAPGSEIPVISREEADVRGLPDYFILFAHNHKKEILAKEAGKFTGKWIEYVPEVRVVKE